MSMAFNSAWYESNGATPAKLSLGQELNRSLVLKWELYDLEMKKDSADLKEFWAEAQRNLKKARGTVARRYNQTRRQAQFQIGDFVLLRLHPIISTVLQRSAKPENKWTVPLSITKLLPAATV
jgi:hypothetical protein